MRWALAFGFALIALGSSSASAINTFKDWDGQQDAWGFGCPDATTLGQVITVHKSAPHLSSFTFRLASQGDNWRDMTILVRAEVYAWDGTKAVGNSLYESEPRTISYDDIWVFHRETFRPAALTLAPGQYVVFLTTAKDYAVCRGEWRHYEWATVSGSAYKGGTLVFQSNVGHTDLWTTQPWQTFSTPTDLAFKADLSP